MERTRKSPFKIIWLLLIFSLLPGVRAVAEDLGDFSWRWNQSFGWIFSQNENSGWLFQPDFGWSYLFQYNDGSFCLWNESNRWLFSSQQAYPACWVLAEGDWSVVSMNSFLLNPAMYHPISEAGEVSGKVFTSLGLFEGGLTRPGVVVKDHWSVNFTGDGQVFWHYSDVVAPGNWQIKDGQLEDSFPAKPSTVLYNDMAGILFWKGTKYR